MGANTDLRSWCTILASVLREISRENRTVQCETEGHPTLTFPFYSTAVQVAPASGRSLAGSGHERERGNISGLGEPTVLKEENTYPNAAWLLTGGGRCSPPRPVQSPCSVCRVEPRVCGERDEALRPRTRRIHRAGPTCVPCPSPNIPWPLFRCNLGLSFGVRFRDSGMS